MEADLSPGTRIAGRYVIHRLLGKGGMGAVYEAEHEELQRLVAVKVLLPRFVQDASAVARFFREARSAATIRHPGIVEVFDLGRDGELAFIVMEKLEGEELTDRIRYAERLGPRFVTEVGMEIADAISAAHDAGVIHRDLKPQNIFLAQQGSDREQVKVLDFGIAKLVDADFSAQPLTRTGDFFGTPLYMSPEQLRGEKALDGRSDVYAMGVILYEALSGNPPYQATTLPDLLIKVVSQDPSPLSQVRGDLPSALSALVMKAMAKDREARFQSARELFDALGAVAATLPDDPPVRFRSTVTPRPQSDTVTSSQNQQRATGSGPRRLVSTGSRPAVKRITAPPTNRRRSLIVIGVVLLVALVAGIVLTRPPSPAGERAGERESPPAIPVAVPIEVAPVIIPEPPAPLPRRSSPEKNHSPQARRPNRRARPGAAMRSFLLIVVLLATTSRADTASEADLQYSLGTELFKQKRYDEALQHFIASDRLVPNANVVLNIATIYAFLKRDTEAFNWFETYLAFDGLDAERLNRARASQSALKARVAVIDVQTTPSGAELFVDRIDLGSVGIGPRKLAVQPGSRTIIARRTGHREARATIDIAKGNTELVSLSLVEITGTLAVNSEPPGATVKREDTGVVLGQTPLTLPLPVGELRVAIGLDRFVEQSKSIRITADQRTELGLTLSRAADQSSVLTVTGAPEGATVKAGDQRIGTIPLTIGTLEPGTLNLLIEAPAHEPWLTQVLLEPGAATRVEVRLVSLDAERFRWLRWLGYGFGAATLAAGGATGIDAIVTRSAFDAAPSRATYDQVALLNPLADGLMIGGVIAIVATVVLDLVVFRTQHSTGTIDVAR